MSLNKPDSNKMRGACTLRLGSLEVSSALEPCRQGVYWGGLSISIFPCGSEEARGGQRKGWLTLAELGAPSEVQEQSPGRGEAGRELPEAPVPSSQGMGVSALRGGTGYSTGHPLIQCFLPAILWLLISKPYILEVRQLKGRKAK